MSRHENVSCDVCLKSNFKGLRYKCLLCFDYDLCANCYEASDSIRTNRGHSKNHPMQCLITRNDFDVYFGGEVNNGRVQSYTCPLCCVMGWSLQSLVDHVSTDHYDTWLDVLCPICISMNIRDPNLVTDYLAGHISLEHSSQGREGTVQESSSRPEIRRIPPALYRGTRSHRNLRTFVNSRFGNSFTTFVSSLETVDPISQLISHLSGRRTETVAESSVNIPNRVQTRRKDVHTTRTIAPAFSQLTSEVKKPVSTSVSEKYVCQISKPDISEDELQNCDQDRADRGLFIQELLLSAIFKPETVLSKLTYYKTLTLPSCYKRVRDETTEMQNKIQAELKLDPIDKEVVVLYQGEQGDASNQFWKGKRIVEMDKERPSWFSKNLLQKTTEQSESVPDVKPKDLA